MEIRIVTQESRTAEQGVSDILSRVSSGLESKFNRISSRSLAECVRGHFRAIYPGSRHYSPDKVAEGKDGSVVIDVPGISRAFGPIDIYPRSRSHLTIAIHRDSYGKTPRQFSDLFPVERKDGKKFLARYSGGNLVMMYFLSTHVHQEQRRGLMPSDWQMFGAICSGLQQFLVSI